MGMHDVNEELFAPAVLAAEQLAKDGQPTEAKNTLCLLARNTREPLLYRAHALQMLFRLGCESDGRRVSTEIYRELMKSTTAKVSSLRIAKVMYEVGMKTEGIDLCKRQACQGDTQAAIKVMLRFGETAQLRPLAHDRGLFILRRMSIARALPDPADREYEREVVFEAVRHEHDKIRHLALFQFVIRKDFGSLQRIQGDKSMPADTRHEAKRHIGMLHELSRGTSRSSNP
jgi:hypothetical protein